MKKWIKRIVIALVVVLVVLQFFRIDKSIPDYDKSGDFIVSTNPPDAVGKILVNACYDCHSYQTTYPWYTEVAPISILIGNHIKDGRKHLNFSVWEGYTAEKKDHKLEECIEEVDENEMPLAGYKKMHETANLSDADRNVLITYFKELRASL